MIRIETTNERSVWLAALMAVASLMLLTACPGSLEDPDRFTQNPDAQDLGSDDDTTVDSEDDGDTGMSACNPSTIQQELFVPSCGNNAACHGDANAGTLNLTEPDVESRTVNVMSPNCTDKTLVVPGDPANSYMLEKVMASPECGASMPIGLSLSQDDIDCLTDWINAQ